MRVQLSANFDGAYRPDEDRVGVGVALTVHLEAPGNRWTRVILAELGIAVRSWACDNWVAEV